MSDNLVYLTNETNTTHLDRDILYSILDKHRPSGAYWFLNVEVMDEPPQFLSWSRPLVPTLFASISTLVTRSTSA